MEKLFETVLALRIRRACQMQLGGRLSVARAAGPYEEPRDGGLPAAPRHHRSERRRVRRHLRPKMELSRSRRTELGHLERLCVSDERLRQSLPLKATRARLPGLKGLPARKGHRVRAHDRRAAGTGCYRDRCSRARLWQRVPGRYRCDDPNRAALDATVIAGTDLRSGMKDFAPFAPTVLPRVLETRTPPLGGGVFACGTVWGDMVAGIGFEPMTFRL